jgi:hypothetical protein
MGKYFGNKYRACLTCDESIKSFVREVDIIVEKHGEKNKEPGKFSAVLKKIPY